MAQALQDRIERDARFASDVSHELRSPLMTLAAVDRGAARTGATRCPTGPSAALDLLVADVDRFQQLVEDLLEISRFDAGAVHLDLEEVRVAELVLPGGRSVDRRRRARRHRRRRWPASWSRPTSAAWSRVIANLLDNAGEVRRRRHRASSCASGGDAVQIAVEDAGPGVPREDRERHLRPLRPRQLGRAPRAAIDGVGPRPGARRRARPPARRRGCGSRTGADGEAGARFVVELPAEAS